MALAFLIGRLIFGGFFLYNGVNMLLTYALATQYAAAKGVPVPEVAVVVAAMLLLSGSASILLGWRPELGIGAIVLFLIAVSFPMHNFWAITNPTQRMMEFGNFIKNMALLGSALMLLAIPQPWPYSVETRHRVVV